MMVVVVSSAYNIHLTRLCFFPACSFAVVIQQLPNPLRDAICIFYLVLRGLDTVEDDMSIPIEEKLPALLRFHDDIYDRSAAAPTIQHLAASAPPAHLGLLHIHRCF
jgi:phytoene/squalene synthetase